MGGFQFDRFSRLFAGRRRARANVSGRSISAAISVATPEPITPDPGRHPEMLFLQSFQSGTIAPVVGAEGRYTVTLEHGLGQTIYYSDRPDRIVGAAPTGQFLEGLGFPPDNPPNAALIVQGAAGETDFAVVELFDPIYDEASHTATYELVALANWEDSTEMGFTAAPSDLAGIAPSFGAAHLFIDGCAQRDVTCAIPDPSNGPETYVGTIPSADFGGWCYDLLDCTFWCNPCSGPSRCGNATEYWNTKCNQSFSACANGCVADY